MVKLLITAVVAAAAIWSFKVWEYSALPELDPEERWGLRESRVANDISVREFQVVFSEEMINDLKHRLKNFRPPAPPLDGVAFQYGFNSRQLDSWKYYWTEKYNFTEREKFLNRFQNFKTNIQGLDIHFIWVKPKEVPPEVAVVPILLLHGWPGSVREFYELIPHLTTLGPGQEFVFEVIAPSLPGFGYSDAPIRSGLGSPQIAVIMRNLMRRLGHQQFYMQAGDWGGEVAADLATLYPDEVLGFHSNLVIVKCFWEDRHCQEEYAAENLAESNFSEAKYILN
ncbi:hypothetical protein MSG28_012874 [Choristoneura fumiferana]|uniref:Uncharacterized protein n=1 Tax=Choristoneura fumiferana TaxID=7141 RepID=A0ACC0JID0_CHOFU|nr:hypothetical protein MSG28_012874 [Choristoneura fumiferana]